MYGLAQAGDESSAKSSSGYGESFAPPLMSGKLPVPENDSDAAMLLRQSKAAWDAHQAAPAEKKKAHVAAVEGAIKAFHEQHPSAFSKKLVQGIEGDANLRAHR